MIVDLERSWSKYARCAGMDTDIFFTDHAEAALHSPSRKVQAAWDKAKMICRDCPVRVQCARDHLGEKDGVWGGLDPAQRYKLRYKHGQNIHRLEGPVKEEYARLAKELREGYSPNDIARIMGVSPKVVRYLLDWTNDGNPSVEEVVEGEPEQVATVTEIPRKPVPWPSKPPLDGDAWVRYGRVVVRGYYLGETEDGEWVFLKVPLSKEYSSAWFKVADVKLIRDMPKVVRQRGGETSRIYGTPISTRKPEPGAKAG